MDKNTITGMVLIFLVLIVFSYLSRPSQEQIAAQQQYYDSIAQVQQRAAELQAKAEAALANERATAAKDSTSLFFGATQGTTELVSIENNLAKLTLSTKGGSLYSVTLKEYMSQDKVTPVTLFEGNDVSLNYLLYNAQGAIETSDYYFTPINKSEQAVTMRLKASNESYVDFTYTMHPDTYLVDLDIQAVGMNGKLASSNNHIDIEWKQKARQIEKLKQYLSYILNQPKDKARRRNREFYGLKYVKDHRTMARATSNILFSDYRHKLAVKLYYKIHNILKRDNP